MRLIRGKPSGALDPPFGDAPEATAGAATWWAETRYEPMTARPRVQSVYGSNSDPDSPSSGILRAAWSDYDAAGRVVASDAAFYQGFVPTAALDYDSAQRANDTSIARVQFEFDAATGHLLKAIDADGYEIDHQYDTFGRRYRTLSPVNDQGDRDASETLFDEYGRAYATEVTAFDPLRTPWVFRGSETHFDRWGRVETVVGDPAATDPPAPGSTAANRISTIEYDALDRVRESRNRWGVDVANPQDHVDDTRVAVFYDGAGRVETRKSFIGYEALQEVWAETSYGYDKDGLLTWMQDAERNRTDWTYAEDVNGVLHGGLGRLRKMRYPELVPSGPRQEVRHASYDQNGNVLEIEFRESDDPSASGLQWRMLYDAKNRMIEREAEWVNLAHDDPGFFGTTKQQFSYDDAGQLRLAVDESAANEFNGTAPNAFAGVESIEVRRNYDAAGRLLLEDQRLPSGQGLRSHLVESTYSPGGFRTKLSFPNVTGKDRYELQYTRNASGRLHEIQGHETPEDATTAVTMTALATYEYVGAQLWSRTHGDGSRVRFHENVGGSESLLFDGLGRVTGIVGELSATPGSEVVDFRYGYDRVGNRQYEQRRHESAGTDLFRSRAFDHDRMGRLTKWREGALGLAGIEPDVVTPTQTALASPTDAESWTLDGVGNWNERATGETSPTTISYTANALNQIETIIEGPESLAPSYDFLGQMRVDPTKGSEGGYRYDWDGFGRMSRVWRIGSEGDVEIARYRYDALGRRVEKRSDAEILSDDVTWFVYDGWRSIEERAYDELTEAETVRARYGHGLGLDEVIWMDRDSDLGPSGLPLPNGTIDRRYYVFTDALGSAAALTSQDSLQNPVEVLERYTYSGYGEVEAWLGEDDGGAWIEASQSYSGTGEAQSRHGYPFLFAGRRLDAETGLYFSRYRYLDPALGRFLRRDPIGYGDGPNVYAYGNARPNYAVDPMGLASKPSMMERRERLMRRVGIAMSPFGVPFNRQIVSREFSQSMVLHKDPTAQQIADSDDGENPVEAELTGEGGDSTDVDVEVRGRWVTTIWGVSFGDAVNAFGDTMSFLTAVMIGAGEGAAKTVYGTVEAVVNWRDTINGLVLAARDPGRVVDGVVEQVRDTGRRLRDGSTGDRGRIIGNIIPGAAGGAGIVRNGLRAVARGGGRAAAGLADDATRVFHHTFDDAVESIQRTGLRPGSYATPTNGLSPLQAHIELALPPNGARNAVLGIDVQGLRSAGYQIPEVTRVSGQFGLPGGGYEMQFPYAIPSNFITVVQP